MKFFNLTLVGKWLTLCCLLFTLGLSGCSGSLNSDSDTSGSTTNTGGTDGSGGTGGTDGTDPEPQPGPLAPTKPTVVDRITTKQGQDVNITGTCTKNANQVNQTDFIRVSISFDGGTEKTETTLCNDDGTWNKAFEGSLFDRDAIGVIKAISVNRDDLIPDSDAGYGLIDVGGVDIVDDQPKPVTPSVQEQTVSEFDPVLIQGSCVADGVQGTSLDTNLISVSINGKSQTATCQDSGAWVVKWNEKIEPGVYPIVAYAENIKDQSSSVASEKALNILYVNPVALVIVPSITAAEIPAGEKINISVSFADANKENGTFSSGNVEVNFRSDCIGAGLAVVEDQAGTPQTQFSSANAFVSANYRTDGCVGEDNIIIEGTFEGESVIALEPVVITIQPDQVYQVNFISKSETNLVTKGNSGVQSSELVFELIGLKGAKIVGESVDFSLEIIHGTLALSKTSEKTDNQGQVRVSVYSGTAPAVIEVKATHPGTGKSIKSGQIAAFRKLTSANNFSIEVDKPSPLSFKRSSANLSPVTVTATVNDRYGWPVIDGTIVHFQVETTQPSQPESGAIGFFSKNNTCETVNGVCQVEWHPNKNDAPDGYVTIFAYALGEEDFIDANSNGFWDDGEEYYDLPEPYLDHTRVWQWNSDNKEEKTNTPYSVGNFWWNDLDNDGVRDEKDGSDKEYNGLICDDGEDVCESRYQYIKAEEVIHQASNDVEVCRNFTQMPDTNSISVPANQSIFLTGLVLCDGENSIDMDTVNGRSQIPTGTQIKFDAKGGTIDAGGEATVIGDEYLPGYRGIKFTAGQELGSATITVNVTIPEGDPNGGGDISYDVQSWNIEVVAPPSFVASKPKIDELKLVQYIEVGDAGASLTGTCPLYSHFDNDFDGGDDIHVPTKYLTYFEASTEKTGTITCQPDPLNPPEADDYYAEGTWSLQISLIPGMTDSVDKRDFQITLVTQEDSRIPLKANETASSYESSPVVATAFVYVVPGLAAVDNSANYISSGGVIALKGTCNEANTTHVEVTVNGDTTEALCNSEDPAGEWSTEVTLGAGSYTVSLVATNKTFATNLPSPTYYERDSGSFGITVD